MVARFRDEYATVAEAAELLGVAQSTVRRWIREEKVPAYRLGDRRIMLKRHEISHLITPRSFIEEHLPDGINFRELRQFKQQPLTDEEQERGATALADLRTLGEELLKRRDGKPYISSLRLIHEGREERTRRILGQ